MKKLVYIGNKLSQSGKTVTSIETLGKFLEDAGYNVVTSSSKTNKIARIFDMLYTVVKHGKTTDYVIIDVYSTSNFYYAYTISLMCKWKGLPYIPILRGGALHKRLRSSPKLCRQIFKHASINVSPSKYLLTYFEEAGFENIVHIPNTIALKDYVFQERELDEIKLLWVRSFSRIYNPKLAVEIVKSLKRKGLSASLCMIGPDNDGSLAEVKNFAKTLDIEEVEFTGKLSKKEWHQKARGYNVFINTTNVDNTPVSVIEAMALGLPVISTNVGGIPYLLKNGEDSLLVEPNNVEAFVEAILMLFDNPDLYKNLAAAARRKTETFDWEIVKHLWFSILS